MTRILGIDPGSRLTGYGCISMVGSSLRSAEHGTLRLLDHTERMESRLKTLFEELHNLIQRLQPDVLCVERVFFAKNALSALKLGQVRGVVLLVGALYDLPVFEYSVTEVKRAITGNGHTEKKQVAKVLQILLGRQNFATEDASDALALALCHAYRGTLGQSPARLALERASSKKSTSVAQSVKHRMLQKPHL